MSIPDDLERAARDAADGVARPIAPGDGALRDTLEQLQVLARVAQVHREAAPRPEPPRGEPVVPLFRWGTLLVLAPLGEGSFGEVYRALDPALGREVALKLRPAGEPGTGPAARRWMDEARRLALVRHPNVVQVHGAAVNDDRPGLWMELISGETLERQLEQRGPLSYREACSVGIELCAALSAVHGAGCVHQDVKASNVMREGRPGREPGAGGSGRIVLMDFGAGVQLDASDHAGWGTIGTPLSTAPEVLAGDPPTPRSDVYSLGALLYRLVSGRHPIESDNVAELLARARAGSITPLRSLRPDLPLAFVTAVERALAPDPAKRWSSAAEFERALAALLAAPGAEIAAGPPPTASARPALLAAAVVAVALAAATAWFLYARSRSEPARSIAIAVPSRAPAAGTAPAGPSPEVHARLLRAVPGGSEEVREGDLVAPGDQLALSLETRERLWVYVLDADRTGKVIVLFPVSGLSPANPIPAGAHRLPGAKQGRSLDWQVTSAGGRETFFFVASRSPLPPLESQIASDPSAREGAAVSGTGEPGGATRGVAGLTESRTVGPGGDPIASLERTLAARADSVWYKRVNVANPGP